MRVLFTAPLDFDPAVWLDYIAAFDALPSPTFPPHSFESNMAEAWVCNPKANFVIDDDVLESFSHLRILATPSTGTNHIDLEACARRGIKVISLLDDRESLNEISASAEFTFKLILDVLRLGAPRELQGKTVGLVGWGRIGKRLTDYLHPFKTTTLVHDPKYPIVSVPLRHLFHKADVVVICCTLNDKTRGMITGQLIESMKPNARLVNTARGEIINEAEMKEALLRRPDIRVALDVLTGETTGTADPDWFTSRGHIVTKHVAGETFDSRTKAARIILNLLKRELEGERRERDTQEVVPA